MLPSSGALASVAELIIQHILPSSNKDPTNSTRSGCSLPLRGLGVFSGEDVVCTILTSHGRLGRWLLAERACWRAPDFFFKLCVRAGSRYYYKCRSGPEKNAQSDWPALPNVFRIGWAADISRISYYLLSFVAL